MDGVLAAGVERRNIREVRKRMRFFYNRDILL